MTNITIQNTNLNLKLVKLNDEEQQAVNARDLHKFLGSKQDFSTWIKARIQKYGFIENEDFIVDKENAQIHDKINSPKRATATDGGFEKATAKTLVNRHHKFMARWIGRFRWVSQKLITIFLWIWQKN